MKLCELLLATASAPSYFEPFQYRDKCFIDGGVWANNPSLYATGVLRAQHIDDLVYSVLNIGTGYYSGSTSLQFMLSMRKNVIDILFDSNQKIVHDLLEQLMSTKRVYYSYLDLILTEEVPLDNYQSVAKLNRLWDIQLPKQLKAIEYAVQMVFKCSSQS